MTNYYPSIFKGCQSVAAITKKKSNIPGYNYSIHLNYSHIKPNL